MGRNNRFAVCAGNASRKLTSDILKILKPRPKVIKRRIETFSDGEIGVEIEQVVRGLEIFVVQTLSAPQNDNLMELVLTVDALYRSDAKSVSAVIPYLAYARQDRRPGRERTAIGARVVADMLKSVAGIRRIITVDVHAAQIQGFFTNRCPFINVESSARFVPDIYARFEKPIIVAPDAGGTERARKLAKQLDADLAVIDKRRPKANVAQITNVIGDVEGRACVMVDDLVDTAGTLCKGAQALKDRGATTVHAYCAHPVLSGPAIDNLEQSVIERLAVTDTISLSPRAASCKKIEVLSMAGILAEVIRRVQFDETVSAMYPD